MSTVSYITPITNRTQADVEYARQNQSDLTNKNKGAWNYTDCNRVCNNLKYAAEGEREEWGNAYPKFAEIAKEEGYPEVAHAFSKILEIEK